MAERLKTIGRLFTRYGLAIVLLWIGGMKFTAYEAEGIQPLVNSPLMGWVYRLVTIDAKFAAGVPPLSEREVLEFAENRDRAATKLAVGPAVGGSDSPDPSGERGEARRVAVDDPAVCCRSRIVSAETVALGKKGGSSPGSLQAMRPGIDLVTATAISVIFGPRSGTSRG